MKTRKVLASVAVFLGWIRDLLRRGSEHGDVEAQRCEVEVERGSSEETAPSPTRRRVTSTKVTVDGVDAEGKPVHHEWTGKFDGKDYPVTGDPTSDVRSYKRVDDRTLEFGAKKGGKVTTTGRVVVSADGKTRTVTTTGTDTKGAKISASAVYDKQ